MLFRFSCMNVHERCWPIISFSLINGFSGFVFKSCWTHKTSLQMFLISLFSGWVFFKWCFLYIAYLELTSEDIWPFTLFVEMFSIKNSIILIIFSIFSYGWVSRVLNLSITSQWSFPIYKINDRCSNVFSFILNE